MTSVIVAKIAAIMMGYIGTKVSGAAVPFWLKIVMKIAKRRFSKNVAEEVNSQLAQTPVMTQEQLANITPEQQGYVNHEYNGQPNSG